MRRAHPVICFPIRLPRGGAKSFQQRALYLLNQKRQIRLRKTQARRGDAMMFDVGFDSMRRRRMRNDAAHVP